MLNDHLAGEEAKEHIRQRIQDAETDSRLKQLGYQPDRTARWIFLLVLIAVVAIGLML
jgi:hypothetical protein